jgi:RNA polymerase sigma-70 factor (ECF subfamily)
VDAETVRAAVRNLPDIQSEVLVLRFLEGRSMEEISAMIGIPVGTVKSRLHNAKGALRKALAELGNGGER